MRFHVSIIDRSRFQRGIGSNLLIALGVLVVFFTIGMAFFNFLRGEQRLTKRLYEREQMIYAAEAAMEEAVVYIRRTMNMEEQSWFQSLRLPTSSLESTVTAEDFDPIFANNLCQETFPSGYSLNVQISLERVKPFIDDPAPDSVEKIGTMRIISQIRVARRTFKVETMREIKVVKLTPPFPLDKYSLWIWKKGKLDLDNEGEPAIPSNLEPLDQKAQEIMDSSWEYTWFDATKRRFPLCIQKISYYFRNVDEFMYRCFNHGIYSLSGIMMVGSKGPGSKLTISGKVQGKGWLITRGVKINVRHFRIEPEFQFTLSDNGNTPISIRGFGSRIFEGLVYLPYSVLDADSNLSIKGFVYADNWNYSGENNLEFDYDRLYDPGYFVTMSEQAVKWVARGRVHDE